MILSFNTSRKNLEWILVILSSILLGIWATKDTIALRNILLVSGTLFSIDYIVQEWRQGELKKQCSVLRALPIVLIAITFVWVIFHYLFFSLDPVQQFRELKSTWVRALMAFIIGLATGLAIRNHPNRLGLLWLGVLVAFLVLFYQYIPRALAQNKLLIPDYDHYLFHLKINTVLMGMILITGVEGALLDHLRIFQHHSINLKIWYFINWLFCSIMVLWAFVYIVDTRNGVGLSIILYCFWIMCTLVFFIRNQPPRLNLKSLLIIFIVSLGLCLNMYFAFLQSGLNKGWQTLVEDAKIAVQIDSYLNWQNTAKMGYPRRENGQMVSPSTYERVAWATAGSKAILAYPKGVGVLAYPFAKHPQAPSKMVQSPAVSGIATHSGWVELGLAFGIPILGLIFSALLLTFINAARYDYSLRMTVLGLVVLITCLYTVGELATQHGIEILFYLLALAPALLLTRPCQIEKND